MPSLVAGGAVTSMLLDATLTYPAAEKSRVRIPGAPVMERLVNAATPLALVIAVGLPPSAPPPGRMLTVPFTHARATGSPVPPLRGIPDSSTTPAPLCRDADGWVAIPRPPGGPA